MRWNSYAEKLIHFGKSKSTALNIITVPYNHCDIFTSLIFDYISVDKKILYVTEEEKGTIAMVREIKNNSYFRKYSYYDEKSGNETLKAKIIFTSYREAMKLNEEFDLVIYDDISCYSPYNRLDILRLMARYSTDSFTKLIAFSTEEIFSEGDSLYIPHYKNHAPLVEPRVLNTRVNTEKEISFREYEYLKWSMDMNRNVVLFTNDKEKTKNIYNYLMTIKGRLTDNIYYFSKGHKEFLDFPNLRRKIVVTEDIEILKFQITPLDILVHGCSVEDYDTKKLLYFCGKVSSADRERSGEVIFLINHLTEAVENTREITRNFNKDAWNAGALS